LLGDTAPLLGTVLTNQAGILTTLGSSLNSLGGALPGLAQTRLDKATGLVDNLLHSGEGTLSGLTADLTAPVGSVLNLGGDLTNGGTALLDSLFADLTGLLSL
jgi:hypothetical protein